jgi:hypothetical protein
MKIRLVLLLLLCAPLFACNPRRDLVSDFRAHRSQYEAIVKAAKALPMSNGTTSEVTLSGFPVFIERDRAGLYTISITTKPLGHVGDYGYTYSDTILVAKPDANYAREKTLGTASGLCFVDHQIDPHWWSVYNNLN